MRDIEAELIQAVGFEGEARTIAAGARLDKSDLDDVVGELLDPHAAQEALLNLAPEEFELMRNLVEYHGGRVRHLDEVAETDAELYLPPLVRGWSYVFRYGHVWDFVVPDQALANAQTIEWGGLESTVESDYSLVRIADTMTSLFGAVRMYDYMRTVHRVQGGRALTLDEALLPVYRAACRGTSHTRIAKAESGNVAIVHEELLRCFRDDEALVVLGEEDAEWLYDAIGQCLRAKSAVSLRMLDEYDGSFDLAGRLAESGSAEALHAYLCAHVPDGEESLKWPSDTLLATIGLARRTVSMKALLDSLAVRGVSPPARHLPELERLLLDLVHEMPHWGCELPCDERIMPEKIAKCACTGPATASPERFRKLFWADNEERIYRETTWE